MTLTAKLLISTVTVLLLVPRLSFGNDCTGVTKTSDADSKFKCIKSLTHTTKMPITTYSWGKSIYHDPMAKEGTLTEDRFSALMNLEANRIGGGLYVARGPQSSAFHIDKKNGSLLVVKLNPGTKILKFIDSRVKKRLRTIGIDSDSDLKVFLHSYYLKTKKDLNFAVQYTDDWLVSKTAKGIQLKSASESDIACSDLVTYVHPMAYGYFLSKLSSGFLKRCKTFYKWEKGSPSKCQKYTLSFPDNLLSEIAQARKVDPGSTAYTDTLRDLSNIRITSKSKPISDTSKCPVKYRPVVKRGKCECFAYSAHFDPIREEVLNQSEDRLEDFQLGPLTDPRFKDRQDGNKQICLNQCNPNEPTIASVPQVQPVSSSTDSSATGSSESKSGVIESKCHEDPQAGNKKLVQEITSIKAPAEAVLETTAPAPAEAEKVATHESPDQSDTLRAIPPEAKALDQAEAKAPDQADTLPAIQSDAAPKKTLKLDAHSKGVIPIGNLSQVEKDIAEMIEDAQAQSGHEIDPKEIAGKMGLTYDVDGVLTRYPNSPSKLNTFLDDPLTSASFPRKEAIEQVKKLHKLGVFLVASSAHGNFKETLRKIEALGLEKEFGIKGLKNSEGEYPIEQGEYGNFRYIKCGRVVSVQSKLGGEFNRKAYALPIAAGSEKLAALKRAMLVDDNAKYVEQFGKDASTALKGKAIDRYQYKAGLPPILAPRQVRTARTLSVSTEEKHPTRPQTKPRTAKPAFVRTSTAQAIRAARDSKASASLSTSTSVPKSQCRTPDECLENAAPDAEKYKKLFEASGSEDFNVRVIQGIIGSFPRLASLYKANNTGEPKTIEEHTRGVMDNFDRQTGYFPLDDIHIPHIANLIHLMKTTIALHDVGKSLGRLHQHKNTLSILIPVMKSLGYKASEIKLASAIVDGDFLGEMIKAANSMESGISTTSLVNKIFDRIQEKAAEAGLSEEQVGAFYRILCNFYIADVSTYNNPVVKKNFEGAGGQFLPKKGSNGRRAWDELRQKFTADDSLTWSLHPVQFAQLLELTISLLAA